MQNYYYCVMAALVLLGCQNIKPLTEQEVKQYDASGRYRISHIDVSTRTPGQVTGDYIGRMFAVGEKPWAVRNLDHAIKKECLGQNVELKCYKEVIIIESGSPNEYLQQLVNKPFDYRECIETPIIRGYPNEKIIGYEASQLYRSNISSEDLYNPQLRLCWSRIQEKEITREVTMYMHFRYSLKIDTSEYGQIRYYTNELDLRVHLEQI